MCRCDDPSPYRTPEEFVRLGPSLFGIATVALQSAFRCRASPEAETKNREVAVRAGIGTVRDLATSDLSVTLAIVLPRLRGLLGGVGFAEGERTMAPPIEAHCDRFAAVCAVAVRYFRTVEETTLTAALSDDKGTSSSDTASAASATAAGAAMTTVLSVDTAPPCT